MTGRNDPCPCGSGKKYKRCCLGKGEKPTPKVASEETPSPRFRFEPGSYGGPGGFMPSIACLKQVRPDDWKYHFVIVRPANVYSDEDAAVAAASRDLDRAFVSRGQSGPDVAVAESLKSAGYVSVKGFKVIGAEVGETPPNPAAQPDGYAAG